MDDILCDSYGFPRKYVAQLVNCRHEGHIWQRDLERVANAQSLFEHVFLFGTRSLIKFPMMSLIIKLLLHYGTKPCQNDVLVRFLNMI
jgi:hypothetical protein